MLRGSVPSVQSGAQHTFALAPQASIPRSSFDRSHGVKTTFDEGYLVPVLVDEMLPGDTFNLQMHAFCRMATPIFPIMDNLYLETFFFAVPNRLLWEHWEEFMGFNPYPVTDPTPSALSVPGLNADNVTGFLEGSIYDYMGLPTGVPDLFVNELPLRAYNLIYNEWFRDENLQDSVWFDVGDSGGNDTLWTLLRRGKRHDYFTSCLPFPQKGPDVELPLGTTAPIIVNSAGTNAALLRLAAAGHALNSGPVAATNVTGVITGDPGAGPLNSIVDPNGSLVADLSAATAATINDLRLAFQTQKLYERDARGGTRYTEIIRSHFGVVSPDMRLQRPEYLGGGSSPIIINPVAQTAPTSGTNAMGHLAAYGVCAPQGHGFTYSATEHCYIIGLVATRADLNYQQGLNRLWSRSVRFDFYWPVLSHIGEQAVLNKEIFAQGTPDDEEVFGYQERYAEYRYKPSVITGRFRSSATASLDAWHLAQDFAALPVLNDEFIVEDAPMTRVQAVNTEPSFILDAFFKYHCVRPMPTYAVPGLVDHF